MSMDTEPVASPHAAAQGEPGSLPVVTTTGRPKTTFYQRHDAVIIGAISLVIVLGLWEWAWQAGQISPLFFSGPSAIAKQFGYAWTKGNLKADIAYSGI